MFNIGMPELVLIFVVVLVVLGPKQLPEVARQLGRLVTQLKKATYDLKQAIEQEPPEEIKKEVAEKLGMKDDVSKPA